MKKKLKYSHQERLFVMNLKSVELVRNIRDENYKNCKNMTTQEKIEYT